MNTEKAKSDECIRDAGTIDANNSQMLLNFLCSSVFICVLQVFLSTSSTAAEILLRDDLDRPIRLQQPARRIVTLAPFLTELVYAAGAGERVVGVSAYSDFPPEAGKLPQVASAAGVSVEQVAALKPDLVLAWRDSVRPED